MSYQEKPNYGGEEFTAATDPADQRAQIEGMRNRVAALAVQASAQKMQDIRENMRRELVSGLDADFVREHIMPAFDKAAALTPEVPPAPPAAPPAGVGAPDFEAAWRKEKELADKWGHESFLANGRIAELEIEIARLKGALEPRPGTDGGPAGLEEALSHLPAVGGRRLTTSLASFERKCRVHLQDLQENHFADNSLIDIICEAVRLGREHLDYVQSHIGWMPNPKLHPDGGLRSIEQAARALSAKLQEIHEDPRYEAVWTFAHVHGQPYKGPTYEAELEALRGALARIELERTAAAQAPTAQSAPPPARELKCRNPKHCAYPACARSEECYKPTPAPPRLMGALADIAAERERQKAVEGWTEEHDDAQGRGEMADAGACYALQAFVGPGDNPPDEWPWDRAWWKPKNPRRDLVRAAALILAEIESCDRTHAWPAAPEAQAGEAP